MAKEKTFKIKHESIDAIRKVAAKHKNTEECMKQVDFTAIKKQLGLNANELKYIESILNGIYAGVDTEEIAAAICRDNAVSAYDKNATCVITFGKAEEKPDTVTTPVEEAKQDTKAKTSETPTQSTSSVTDTKVVVKADVKAKTTETLAQSSKLYTVPKRTYTANRAYVNIITDTIAKRYLNNTSSDVKNEAALYVEYIHGKNSSGLTYKRVRNNALSQEFNKTIIDPALKTVLDKLIADNIINLNNIAA